jgi:hypothetical protein
MRAQSTRAAAVVASVVVALAACGGDDDSDTGAEAPPDSGGLVVTSAAFTGEPIPVQYTCDGDETTPPLTVDGIPADTAELAVVVRDPDADGFVHWVVAGLPADTAELAEGGPLPDGAVEADNGFGEPGWAGPCPPEGDHTYELTVYALGEPSGLSDGADADDGAETVEGTSVLAMATLRGTYERS